MKTINAVGAASCVVAFWGILCGTDVNGFQKSDVRNVSMIRLIANPEKYSGMRIATEGYLSTYAKSYMALYCSEIDQHNGLELNSLDLRLTEKQFETYRGLDKRYVLVEGQFDTSDLERGIMFSGTLKDVTKVERVH